MGCLTTEFRLLGEVGVVTSVVPELEVDKMEDAESDCTLLARDSVDRRLLWDPWTSEFSICDEDDTDIWSLLSNSLPPI